MRTTFAATALSIISAVGLGKIIDFTDQDNLGEMFPSYDFTFLSGMVPSDPDSVIMNALFDKAEAIFEEKMESGEWPKRSVGWFRTDLEKYPMFALNKEASSQQMMVSNKYGAQKVLGFQKHYEDPEMNAQLFASVIRELSGDFVQEVECDKI